MGLVGVLVMSGFLAAAVDLFYMGFWVFALAAFLGGGFLFSNLGIECVGGSLWNSGFSCLVVMSLWVVGLCFLSTERYSLKMSSFFSLCFLGLGLVCVMFFLSSSWFLLYFFFECSLVPLIVLILGWGYQPERLQAAGYILVYTVCGSLPFLVMLVRGYYQDGVMSLFAMGGFEGSSQWGGGLVLLPLLLVFMVKLPVFGVHSWLPKAHVEAPVSGSMVLAGVLLKFGGCGCVLVFYYFMVSSGGVVDFLISLGLWGGVLCSCICMRQVDLKSLVAYSSVGHMSFCFGGVLGCFGVGWMGGLMLMVAHGFCSPGLFALVGYLYSLFGSRSLYVCCGVVSLVPSLSLCWFLMCSSNMSFPPSFSVLGEILVVLSMVSYSMWFLVPVGLMFFLVGVYSLLMFSTTQYGGVGRLTLSGGVLGSGYLVVCYLLWVPLNLFLLASDLMLGWW